MNPKLSQETLSSQLFHECLPDDKASGQAGMGLSCHRPCVMINLAKLAIKRNLVAKNLTDTSRKSVKKNKVLLQKTTKLISSPLLKGRLAEVYFLREGENIGRNFWKELNTVLEKFIKQKEALLHPEEMKNIKENYRMLKDSQGGERV